MSRAYYGAFHFAECAKRAIPELPHDEKGAGSHEELIRRYLSHQKCKDAVKLGYILRDMKSKRRSADYVLNGDCVESEVSVQINQARRIETLVETILSAARAAESPSANDYPAAS